MIKIRKDAALTQEQMAEVLNISVSTLRRWEAGEHTPKMCYLNIYAENFGVNLNWLLGEQVSPYSKNLPEKAEPAMAASEEEEVALSVKEPQEVAPEEVVLSSEPFPASAGIMKKEFVQAVVNEIQVRRKKTLYLVFGCIAALLTLVFAFITYLAGITVFPAKQYAASANTLNLGLEEFYLYGTLGILCLAAAVTLFTLRIRISIKEKRNEM